MGERITMEEAQKVADGISLIVRGLSYVEGALWHRALDEMAASLGEYEAIGILDGAQYLSKVADLEARVARLRAIVALYDESMRTEKDVRRG